MDSYLSPRQVLQSSVEPGKHIEDRLDGMILCAWRRRRGTAWRRMESQSSSSRVVNTAQH